MEQEDWENFEDGADEEENRWKSRRKKRLRVE